MDERTAVQQQSTSILELLYLIKAKNRGDISFAEFMALASVWARAVIAESETSAVNEDKCG